MKLVAFFTLVLTLQVSARTHAQTISLSLRNAPLRSVFREIRRQAGMNFVYNNNLLQQAGRIDINVSGASVSEVLEHCLRDRQLSFKMIGKTIVITPKPQGAAPVFSDAALPAGHIHGRITGENGEPIAGASIRLKGVQGGVVSGENGEFQMDLPDNAPDILIISYVGMEPLEVHIAGKTEFQIRLKRALSQQQEVVVIGYGAQKKGNLTGAVTNVKGEDLEKNSSANVSNSLAGRTAGVIANNRSGRPGDDASTIYIRGFNSFGGGSAPLVVVDGIPDRDMNRINPSDIESVTILKDASAAIYGVRSANGVILVTTKRGKSGKPTIKYDGTYGLQQLTRLDKRVNAWEYMTYYNELNVNQGNTAPYTQTDIDKYKAGNDPNYTSTDWLNAVFRKEAPLTSHSLSVGGGSDQVKYYFSGQYLDQKSNFRNSNEDFNQFNIRSNIDAKISDNLKVNVDLALRRENRVYPSWSVGSILHETVSMYPFLPVYWQNGLPDACISNGRNPVVMTSSQPGYDKVTNLIANPKLGFELQLPWVVKGLSVSGYGAFDYNSRKEKKFQQPWDAYTYDKTSGTYINMRNSTSITSIMQDEQLNNQNTFFVKLAFDRQFGLHNLNVFAGYEQNTTNYTETYAYRRDLLSTQLDQLFTGSTVGQTATGSAAQDGRESYLGRLAYSYDNKYLVEGTARYNGSFNFPSNRRWGLFPSVSLGWKISEEAFFRNNIHVFDQFKIRGSWGLMGSDAVAQYLYLTRYQLVTNPELYTYFGPDFTLANAIYLTSTPNPDITWEKQDTKNLGFDASLLSNKLSVSFDVFRFLRRDILAQRNASVPLYTGLALPSENIGKSLNRGVEFAINYNERNTVVKYRVGVNFTYAKSKILFRDESPNIPAWQRSTGQPIDAWLVYRTSGIYHTQQEIDKTPHLQGAKPGDLWIKDIDGDGYITSNDMVRVPESATPKLVYGITMGAEYKGLALDLVWSGQGMAKQMILSQMQGSLVAPPTWLYDGRYTAANPNAPYPRAFNSNDSRNSLYADFWLRDASFLRLKSAELSYTVPVRILRGSGFTSARVYVGGFNLLSFDKMKKYNIDPETNNTTGINYPQSRVYRCGINLGL